MKYYTFYITTMPMDVLKRWIKEKAKEIEKQKKQSQDIQKRKSWFYNNKPLLSEADLHKIDKFIEDNFKQDTVDKKMPDDYV